MTDPQFALQCAIVDIQSQIGQTVTNVQYELTRPFMMVRPSLSKDGDHWCFLFGENLQEGVAGFGKTPAEAAAAFDKAWWNETIKLHSRSERKPSTWIKPGSYVSDEHGTPITGLSWCAAQPHEKNTSHCPACGVGPLEACRGRVPQDDQAPAPTENLDKYKGAWGVENTGSTIWVGPMRPDGIKVDRVVYGKNVAAYKQEYVDLALADAHLIADSVNASIARLRKEPTRALAGIAAERRRHQEGEREVAALDRTDAVARTIMGQTTALYALTNAIIAEHIEPLRIENETLRARVEEARRATDRVRQAMLAKFDTATRLADERYHQLRSAEAERDAAIAMAEEAEEEARS